MDQGWPAIRASRALAAATTAAVGALMSKMLQLPLRSKQQWASIALQAALVVVIGGLAYGAFINAADNLAKAHIASGFRFWDNTAGFDGSISRPSGLARNFAARTPTANAAAAQSALSRVAC